MADTPDVPSLLEALAFAEHELQALPLDDLRRVGVHRTPLEYYLVGTYPPLKYLHSIDADEVFEDISAKQNVYLHLPFCEQHCTFCHFHKEIQPDRSRVDRYLDGLRMELQLVTERAQRGGGSGLIASSLYFGGGTPSFLQPHQLQTLFDDVRRHVSIGSGTEVTFELHPGVVRQADFIDRLDAVAAGPVNRWVFGVQSMDEAILAKLNRGHGRAEVFRLLQLLDDRGITNLNVDLMFGLPLQTMESWYATIVELIQSGLNKFNIFPLMFKRSDPITRQYMKDPGIFPDAAGRLRMHFVAEYVVRSAGFRRGPAFYYSRTAVHSQQQRNKFDTIEDDNLVALGVSSFGYVGGTQYYNVCDTTSYLRAVENGELPVWRGHTLSAEERVRRAAMFGLRSEGIDLDVLLHRHGVDGRALFDEQLRRLSDLGLLQTSRGTVTVTDRGAAFVDGIGYLFASPEVRAKVAEVNEGIESPSVDPVDRYDYSPIGRIDVPGGIVDVHRDRTRG